MPRQLISCSDVRSINFHRLEALSLGEPVDAASSSSSMGFESVSMREGQASTLSSVCVLTDHPLIPHMTSKLQLFTGGFVIEGSDAGMTYTQPFFYLGCFSSHVSLVLSK